MLGEWWLTSLGGGDCLCKEDWKVKGVWPNLAGSLSSFILLVLASSTPYLFKKHRYSIANVASLSSWLIIAVYPHTGKEASCSQRWNAVVARSRGETWRRQRERAGLSQWEATTRDFGSFGAVDQWSIKQDMIFTLNCKMQHFWWPGLVGSRWKFHG